MRFVKLILVIFAALVIVAVRAALMLAGERTGIACGGAKGVR